MAETAGSDMKQARLNNPSAWMTLTRYESVRLMIDALLEAPPDYQFNKTDLRRRTGLSREAIREHLPLLVELGVIQEVDSESWPEYKLRTGGKVTKELFALNSALNSVLSGGAKTVEQTGSPDVPLKESSTEQTDSHDTDTTLLGNLGVDNATRDRTGDSYVESPPSGGPPANAD